MQLDWKKKVEEDQRNPFNQILPYPPLWGVPADA